MVGELGRPFLHSVGYPPKLYTFILYLL
uniref:Uncharacterized protein n=1 Tax=Arundo donax TaxID=35708 RepID=A0A0A8XU82_ARUDO